MEISKINELLDEICQNIGGKWLLTGGSLIQLEVDSMRATEDIDLIAIEHDSLSDVGAQQAMFKAAIGIGLSPENVNSAASFFVQQIADWKSHLVVLRSSPMGTIFRPDLTLFIVLKLARGTEIDLKDVGSAIQAFGANEFRAEAFEEMANHKSKALFEKNRKQWGL
jgi:hypothetical protein